MRVYLDLCALKRPYDQPTEDRIVLEALAVAAIVKAFESRRLELISSTVLELENSKNPQEDRRVEVADVLRRMPTTVRSGEELLRRSRELLSHGFRSLDALHVACAESAKCDYFVTCDDRLQAAASRAGARILV
ncbi:MAG: PIN domain-containing protein [Planctomycetes bacterium]|nr:PIN domain-containing protein [Planctomycetota bacterium]